jgi:hypothetical protein
VRANGPGVRQRPRRLRRRARSLRRERSLENNLATRCLRASGAFTLVGVDELELEEQESLATLREDPDFYGILKSRSALLPAKSVSKEAALLFLTLQRARRIPLLLASIFGDDLSPLHALLADGVLEVEHDGAFISGQNALRLFRADTMAAPATHRIARLSAAAIACAASYDGLDAAALSEKVYVFGRKPCTPALRRRFAKDVDLLAFLAPDSSLVALLTETWTSDDPEERLWLSWRRRTSVRLGYKLYVSARIEAMPTMFAATLRAMKRTGCESFKIGRHGEGVCRPDKLVAYFVSLDQLRECASLIETDLVASKVDPGLAHGVPFTAGIDVAGFLSWGMDPPELASVPEWLSYQSFRQWVASRVAVAVLTAKGESAGPDEIVSFVRARVELDGIDPDTWSPNLAIWREHAAKPRDVA